MAKIEAVIFDLDGVLVHTDHFHYLAWKEIADSLGIPFDERINQQLRGVSRMESLDIILQNYHGEKLNDDEKHALAEQKNKKYRTLLKTLTPQDVSREVRETLTQLKQWRYPIAVGSSSKNAKMILKQIELMEEFDGIVDGNDISRSKPDPQVFVKAAACLKVNPENCLVIEDAKAGIDAAKSAGMKAAAIHDAVSYEKADYRLEKISDLLNIMKANS